MRQLSQILALLLLFIHIRSRAQTDIRQDWRVDTLLKQVHAKRPGLNMFARNHAKGKYVNMAVLCDSTCMLTWFTCYGQAFDKVRLDDDVYNKIKSGSVDPFIYYKDYFFHLLSQIGAAAAQFRQMGKAVLNDAENIYHRVYTYPPVQQAGNTLQQEVAMEKLMSGLSLQLSLFDSRTPQQLMPSDSFQLRRELAGRMIRNGNTTTYYNINPLSSAARIVLYKQAPDKMFVYDRRGRLTDSVPLRTDKHASLLNEKEDVFLLYRGWLELQSQQAIAGKEEVARLLNRQYAMLYKPVYWEQNKQDLQRILLDVQERIDSISQKVMGLIVPPEEETAQLLANVYWNKPAEISYLQTLGFAYSVSYIRGDKRYELTDNRGDVMAAVSDRKKAIDDNSDGSIDYYKADVVSAVDYLPFGGQMPGRSYSGEDNYRYGYNGKENDNEVKGEGSQQDYGMRIYDPRVGRFLSVDPITANYPGLTPYQFASNSPISGIDQDGLEFFGAGYLVDEAAKGLSKLGLNRTAGFVNSYGHSLFIDPVYSAHGVIKTANQGDVTGTLKQFDPTGITSIPDIYETGKKAVQGDPYAQGQILGLAPSLYGGFRSAKAGGLKLSGELSPGTQTAGFSLSRGFSGLVKKVSEFKLVHLTETILKSESYKKIQVLTDAELIESVLRPKDGSKVTVNTRTGGVVDGNTRIFEMQRRGLNNVEVPFEEYTPNDSMFPELKEPPKKE